MNFTEEERVWLIDHNARVYEANEFSTKRGDYSKADAIADKWIAVKMRKETKVGYTLEWYELYIYENKTYLQNYATFEQLKEAIWDYRVNGKRDLGLYREIPDTVEILEMVDYETYKQALKDYADKMAKEYDYEYLTYEEFVEKADSDEFVNSFLDGEQFDLTYESYLEVSKDVSMALADKYNEKDE